jgi:hypothetical protein
VEAGLLIDCMAGAVSIRPYGDWHNATPTYGYTYSDPSINSGTPFPETALNLTAADDPDAAWLTLGTSACKADIGSAVRKVGRLAGVHVQAAPHAFFSRAKH